MTDFGKTIIGGLVLLIIGVIIFNSLDFSSSPGRSTGSGSYNFAPSGTDFGPSIKDTTYTTEQTGFYIGARENATKTEKTIQETQFKVKYFARSAALAGSSVIIKNGAFYENNREEFIFNLEDPEVNSLIDPTLTLSIWDTNFYGELEILFNGNRIFFDRPGKGIITLPLDTDLFENENTLLIQSTSSSWRLWAPTVYDLSFDLKSGVSDKSQGYEFTLDSRILPANNVEISFRPIEVEGSGNLSINLNGNSVFNEVPRIIPTNEVDVPVHYLRAGKNTLTMESDGDAIYTVENLKVTVVHDAQAFNPVIHEFTLEQEDFEQLPGTITFKIDEIEGEPTGLTVTTINKNGFTSRKLVLEDVEEGVEKIKVDDTELSRGLNKLRFRLSGSGGVQISDIRVIP